MRGKQEYDLGTALILKYFLSSLLGFGRLVCSIEEWHKSINLIASKAGSTLPFLLASAIRISCGIHTTMTANNPGHDTIQPVHESPEATQTNGGQVSKFLNSIDNNEFNHDFTFEEEKQVLRRIDMRVLPILLGAYFFQQLDKSSLSYVSIFGLVEDAHLVGQQYSWLGSILYLAQLVMQPLAAVLLVKAPTGKVIGTAVFLWGSSLAIMAACTDFKSLLGLRFALGAFESMIGEFFMKLWLVLWSITLRSSRFGSRE